MTKKDKLTSYDDNICGCMTVRQVVNEAVDFLLRDYLDPERCTTSIELRYQLISQFMANVAFQTNMARAHQEMETGGIPKMTDEQLGKALEDIVSAKQDTILASAMHIFESFETEVGDILADVIRPAINKRADAVAALQELKGDTHARE